MLEPVFLLAWSAEVVPSKTSHSPAEPIPRGHLSTRQYAQLVDEWVTAIGLRPEEYGTNSPRRTKASLIYKATGN